jgi:hypothetical protein
MTPDIYTNLRFLNATNLSLNTNDVGSYQMTWNFPTNSPLLGPQSYSQPYLLQFLRGAGDEDDAGNANIMIETFPIAFLYGGSAPNSAHYLQITLTSPGPTFLFAVGVVTTADWPQSVELSSLVNWLVPPTSPGQVVNLGPLAVPGTNAGSPNMAIAFVDLSQIFPQDASTFQNAIQGNTLTTQQVESLWTQVSNYSQIVPSSSS